MTMHSARRGLLLWVAIVSIVSAAAAQSPDPLLPDPITIQGPATAPLGSLVSLSVQVDELVAVAWLAPGAPDALQLETADGRRLLMFGAGIKPRVVAVRCVCATSQGDGVRPLLQTDTHTIVIGGADPDPDPDPDDPDPDPAPDDPWGIGKSAQAWMRADGLPSAEGRDLGKEYAAASRVSRDWRHPVDRPVFRPHGHPKK